MSILVWNFQKLPQDYKAGSTQNKVTLNIQIRTAVSRINLETDESYDLKITTDENDMVRIFVLISGSWLIPLLLLALKTAYST